MIAIGIMISVLAGILSMGGAMLAEERPREKNKYILISFWMMIVSIGAAYCAGVLAG